MDLLVPELEELGVLEEPTSDLTAERLVGLRRETGALWTGRPWRLLPALLMLAAYAGLPFLWLDRVQVEDRSGPAIIALDVVLPSVAKLSPADNNPP